MSMGALADEIYLECKYKDSENPYWIQVNTIDNAILLYEPMKPIEASPVKDISINELNINFSWESIGTRRVNINRKTGILGFHFINDEVYAIQENRFFMQCEGISSIEFSDRRKIHLDNLKDSRKF